MNNIKLDGRLGFSLEVSPEELKVLTGEDRMAAKELLVSLVQSESCHIVGDTYFPVEWNEDVLSYEMEDNLSFDLPVVSLKGDTAIKATEVPDLTVSKAHCDWIVEQAKELKALLSYNSDEMIVLNNVRALSAIDTAMRSLRELKLFINEACVEKNKPELDNIIKSCEEVSKNNEAEFIKNEYYKTSDGFFDYYVNRKTGEKKFKLDENDVEVERKADDFFRDVGDR